MGRDRFARNAYQAPDTTGWQHRGERGMIRAQAFGGGNVVHLWAPDPVNVSGRALCGAAGPAILDRSGRLCAACWRFHGKMLGSVTAQAAIARGR